MIVDPEQADYRYLFYQLLHARPRIKSLSTGAAQQNLSGRLIKSLKFSFPCLAEQRAIGHILGTLDDKIELNRRMNGTLEAIARALFKSWFVDFDPVRAKVEGRDLGLPPDIADLFPDRLVDSEMGEIPLGWEVSQIGEEVDAVGGSTLARRSLPIGIKESTAGLHRRISRSYRHQCCWTRRERSPTRECGKSARGCFRPAPSCCRRVPQSGIWPSLRFRPP